MAAQDQEDELLQDEDMPPTSMACSQCYAPYDLEERTPYNLTCDHSGKHYVIHICNSLQAVPPWLSQIKAAIRLLSRLNRRTSSSDQNIVKKPRGNTGSKREACLRATKNRTHEETRVAWVAGQSGRDSERCRWDDQQATPRKAVHWCERQRWQLRQV